MENINDYNSHLKQEFFNRYTTIPHKTSDFNNMKNNVLNSLVTCPEPIVQKLQNLNWKKMEIKTKAKISQEKSTFYLEPSQVAVMHLIFNENEKEIKKMHLNSSGNYLPAFNKLDDNHGKYHFYSSCLISNKFNSQFGGSSKRSIMENNPGGFQLNSMATTDGRLFKRSLMEMFMRLIIVCQMTIWRALFTKEPLLVNGKGLCLEGLLNSLKYQLNIIIEAVNKLR